MQASHFRNHNPSTLTLQEREAIELSHGVHQEGDSGRSIGDANLQFVLFARELSDEVLLLPYSLMAAAPLCGRGLQWKDCGIRLAKMEESSKCHGHITSLALLRTHRKLGLATKLMTAAQNAMEQVYGAEYVALHVRKSNRAAFNFCTETLEYKIHDVEAKYYADGEDGYDMRKQLKGKKHHHQHDHHHPGGRCCSADEKPVSTPAKTE